MKKTTLFLLTIMVVPVSVVLASGVTRTELDAQMRVAKAKLDGFNAQKATEMQRLAEAENAFKGRQSSLTESDLETIRTITAQTVGELDSQITTVKESIKTLGRQIKALKNAAQPAASAASAESEGRAMASVASVAQEFQSTVSPVRETRLQEIVRTSREKMGWIIASRAEVMAELDELKTLGDRHKANSGMLPEDSLARLRGLQSRESKNRKCLIDMSKHEEGLIKFLTGKGLLHVLSDFPRISPEKHQLDNDDDQEDQQQNAPKKERRVRWRPSLVHATEIPNNDGQGGVDLAAAAVDRDFAPVVSGRRNTRVGSELPVMDDRGVITVQRGRVTVQSASENDEE